MSIVKALNEFFIPDITNMIMDYILPSKKEVKQEHTDLVLFELRSLDWNRLYDPFNMPLLYKTQRSYVAKGGDIFKCNCMVRVGYHHNDDEFQAKCALCRWLLSNSFWMGLETYIKERKRAWRRCKKKATCIHIKKDGKFCKKNKMFDRDYCCRHKPKERKIYCFEENSQGRVISIN